VSADASHAGDDRFVVGEAPIAMELVEIFDDHVDVIARLRPRRMAGHLHGFPRGEVAISFAKQRREILPQPADLGGVIDPFCFLHHDELVDLPLQLKDRLFEFEHIGGGFGRWGRFCGHSSPHSRVSVRKCGIHAPGHCSKNGPIS
jgi:hypothetical protein